MKVKLEYLRERSMSTMIILIGVIGFDYVTPHRTRAQPLESKAHAINAVFIAIIPFVASKLMFLVLQNTDWIAVFTVIKRKHSNT